MRIFGRQVGRLILLAVATILAWTPAAIPPRQSVLPCRAFSSWSSVDLHQVQQVPGK
jgi:hypothetical protein